MNIEEHVEAVRVKVKEEHDLELPDPAVTLARLHYMNNMGVDASAKAIGEALLQDIKAGFYRP